MRRLQTDDMSRDGAGRQLPGNTHHDIAAAECDRRERKIGPSPSYQQDEHEEGVLNKQHIPTDRLARMSSRIPPEHTSDQSPEKRRHGLSSRDAAEWICGLILQATHAESY